RRRSSPAGTRCRGCLPCATRGGGGPPPGGGGGGQPVRVRRYPLPSPPHKGEGAPSSSWHHPAPATGRHLPPCGGGWEGGARGALSDERGHRCRSRYDFTAGSSEMAATMSASWHSN